MRLGRIALLALVAGGCSLAGPRMPEAGRPGPAEEARWALAPEVAIGPDTTEFVAMVTEVGCASGQSSMGRVVGPEIDYTEAAVIVTFGVRPPDGEFQECPGNPATPVAVTLDEPLGDRQLLDGWSDPPREPPVCIGREFCE